MKRVLDSFDFCNWSLGHELNPDDYEVPDCDIYMPDLEELIDNSNKEEKSE